MAAELVASGDTRGEKAYAIMCERYLAGDGINQNSAEAVRLCRITAEQGNPAAQYQLAIIYEFGTAGVPKDMAVANRLYRQIFQGIRQQAATRDANARFMLARMFELGRGTEVSLSQAVHWYLSAGAIGHPRAISRIRTVLIYKYGIDAIFRTEFALQSSHNDPDSLYIAGVMADNGWGAKRSQSRAIEYYLRAAKLGSPVAQYTVGLRYGAGDGLPRDEAKMKQWWKKAADAGYAPAIQAQKFMESRRR
ncbi:tetratricopeptide repeat protein [Mariprofundus erugo]|uniref:tetratricopeptide repeat protein n=1 Tax=Mariprofundus erugo TaxID=2528639 RepID=UPI0013874112|nr:tetratricopeptide repeat protein [Mariprofundus erugo]